MKKRRVIAVLDLSPRRARRSVRDSFEAAANRWQAELVLITRNLESVHPYWQKMFVCEYVQSCFGNAHILQLDNDILIRSDCPSPFDLMQPKQFGMIAERQCPIHRIDNGGWQDRAHKEWASRCGLRPAFTWLHPNGGFYLYESEFYALMFERIRSYLRSSMGASDHAVDESLIINELFNHYPEHIAYLPADFNVNLRYASAWARNPVMHSYIYHFVGKSKQHIEMCRWQRSDPPQLPFANDAAAKQLMRRWGTEPPSEHNIGSIFTPQHAANLLAVFPRLHLSGNWSYSRKPLDARLLSHVKTHSTHLVLMRFLLALGPNSRRFRLSIN